ncbi:MAG: WD40/YVTN/BNR-like repeat-containing protein [Limisphaerales bacterium]
MRLQQLLVASLVAFAPLAANRAFAQARAAAATGASADVAIGGSISITPGTISGKPFRPNNEPPMPAPAPTGYSDPHRPPTPGVLDLRQARATAATGASADVAIGGSISVTPGTISGQPFRLNNEPPMPAPAPTWWDAIFPVPRPGCPPFVALSTNAEPLNLWQTRSLAPLTNSLASVTYGNRTFAAVGVAGTVLTSAQGVTWTNQTSGTTNSLRSITYGAGMFVAVGDRGMLLTSPDAISWTTQSSGSADPLNGIAFRTNGFVAVGDRGAILTSSDAISWISRVSVTTNDLKDIVSGNGTFVAVGTQGTILTSRDGVAWSNRTVAAPGGFNSVAYGNGSFVAVGDLGAIATSHDAITWTSCALLAHGYANDCYSLTTNYDSAGITYDHGTFVAVGVAMISFQPTGCRFLGGDPARVGGILTSPDGFNWTSRPSGTDRALFGAAYGNGTFVAVGEHGTILQSGDLGPVTALSQLQVRAGGIALHFTGQAGQVFRVQATTDLTLSHWVDLATITNSAGTVSLIDPAGANLTHRFYRVVQQ